VHHDRLTCGEWVIPYEAIQELTLHRVTDLMKGHVLVVRTEADVFQFGMRASCPCIERIPLQITTVTEPPPPNSRRTALWLLTVGEVVVLLLALLFGPQLLSPLIGSRTVASLAILGAWTGVRHLYLRRGAPPQQG
jgi:hypothetical protein